MMLVSFGPAWDLEGIVMSMYLRLTSLRMEERWMLHSEVGEGHFPKSQQDSGTFQVLHSFSIDLLASTPADVVSPDEKLAAMLAHRRAFCSLLGEVVLKTLSCPFRLHHSCRYYRQHFLSCQSHRHH